MSQRSRSEESRRPAVWAVRLRWPSAIGFAIIPVVFTALTSAIAQVAHAGETASALVIACGAAVSAAVGLAVMGRSAPTLRHYGFRTPRDIGAAWWFVPLAVTVVVVIVTAGIHVTWQAALAYAVLAGTVAVNEEVWFRGIVLAVLRRGGVRVAIIGSSALFGVLHLANLAGGEAPAVAVLQLVFAVVFGFVAAELVVVVGSLWPAIAWHAAWDFTNYLGGNATNVVALGGVGAASALALAYALLLMAAGDPQVMRR